MALIASCGGGGAASDAETKRFGDGDVGILNYALLIQHVEAALYRDIAAADIARGSEKTTLQSFQGEEEEHVDALARVVETLGGTPTREPKTRFPLQSGAAALTAAEEVENVGAAAYLGQLEKIESRAAKRAILSIYSVEGRHAATIAMLRGRSITPQGPLAKPARVPTVLRSIEPFLAG